MSKRFAGDRHSRVSSVSDAESDKNSILSDQDRPELTNFSRQGSRTVFSRQGSAAGREPVGVGDGSLERSGIELGQDPPIVVHPDDVEKGTKTWEPHLSPVKPNSKGDEIFYDLSVINLTYKVTEKKGKQTVEKVLLNQVTARARHGEVLAIAGPSGSSKTTFLDAIAGRIQQQSLEGSVLVNGKPWDSSFMKVSQYVMQDDALFPMLTTRETLLFSAKFRLPSSMPYAEKLKRVEVVIQQLGLKSCADTYVGNELVKGVSGGERRRISIGSELIHDPAVLFLDEPTSGLDSTSALHVMEILSMLALERNRTVILTIHQPSYRILNLINTMLVLARGNVVYHGSYDDMATYFKNLGRELPEHVNIVEYALDTIEEYQEDPEGLNKLVAFQKEKQKVDDLQRLASLRAERNELPQRPSHVNSFLVEAWTLADRTSKNIFRTPELFFSRIGLMVSTALILGTIFLKLDYNEKGSRQRQAFMAFTLALFIFTSTEALPVFLNERHIFIREVSRGAYRASTYTLAQAAVFIPFLFVLAVLYTSISYFMVDLVHNANAFFIVVLTLFLTLVLSNSFVAFIGSVCPNFLIGQALVSAICAYYFLFSGFFIPRSSIPDYWIWMHYLSIFKYPYEILLHNEYTRAPVPVWYGSTTSADILRQLSAGKVHIWNNVAVMVSMIVGYRILFYLVLRFRTNNVRK